MRVRSGKSGWPLLLDGDEDVGVLADPPSLEHPNHGMPALKEDAAAKIDAVLGK